MALEHDRPGSPTTVSNGPGPASPSRWTHWTLLPSSATVEGHAPGSVPDPRGPQSGTARYSLSKQGGELVQPTAGTAAGDSPGAEADFERVRALADAILYEGYLLYPYRKSSAKNRVRWQFGIVAPRDWAESAGPVPESVAGSVESWQQQTECLVEPTSEAEAARVHVRVRFLQWLTKTVERREPDGRFVPVESLEDESGTPQLSFDEAVPHECDIVAALPDLLETGVTIPIGAPESETVEQLGDAGRAVRRCLRVRALARLRAQRLDTPVPAYRLRLRIENTDRDVGAEATRTRALRHSLIATHALLGGRGLTWHSLTDPPSWAARDTRACHNIHTFPVLVGEPGGHGGMLSSPILLHDYPGIAPESPGDLHDATEIDEILSLRTLTLTEEEKREARATDPRAAAIVDRVEGMPREVLARLHGAVRSLRPYRPATGTVEGGQDGSV